MILCPWVDLEGRDPEDQAGQVDLADLDTGLADLDMDLVVLDADREDLRRRRHRRLRHRHQEEGSDRLLRRDIDAPEVVSAAAGLLSLSLPH